jgi:hypothetical protein
MSEYELEKFEESLKDKIYSIRGHQAMLDRDLAELYGVETRRINEAVKRNKERFPDTFCFKLSNSEYTKWKSQIATSIGDKMGLRKLPYAFTELGVAMLAGILKSDIAVKISIKIIEAFVEMRKFLQSNAQLFQRIESVEVKMIETNLRLNATDSRIDQVFSIMESGDAKFKQGVFFENQIFDAYHVLSEIFRTAKKSIKKFSAQYFPIEAEIFTLAHDRYIVIDHEKVYHVGASLKDLGKKWFAFSKIEKSDMEVISRLKDFE